MQARVTIKKDGTIGEESTTDVHERFRSQRAR
jgi:hypothetical protein